MDFRSWLESKGRWPNQLSLAEKEDLRAEWQEETRCESDKVPAAEKEDLRPHLEAKEFSVWLAVKMGRNPHKLTVAEKEELYGAWKIESLATGGQPIPRIMKGDLRTVDVLLHGVPGDIVEI